MRCDEHNLLLFLQFVLVVWLLSSYFKTINGHFDYHFCIFFRILWFFGKKTTVNPFKKILPFFVGLGGGGGIKKNSHITVEWTIPGGVKNEKKKHLLNNILF